MEKTYSWICYDPNCPELIFPLAVFQRNLNNEIIFMPTDLGHLLENPPPEEAAVYLLNLYPKNDFEKNKLHEFMKNYENQIEFWFDNFNNHEWDEKQLAAFNYERNIIFGYEGKSCLELMMHLGYVVQLDWFDWAHLIASDDWAKDELTSYYRKCYEVAKLYSQNLKSDDLANFFCLAADELAWINLPEKKSTKWFTAYEIIEANTLLAKKSIRLSPHFQGLRGPDEEIGYANLGMIDHNIDLDEVVRIGRHRFPWLFVLQYTYNEEDYTGVFSKINRAKKWLGIKHNTFKIPKDQALALLREKLKRNDKVS